MNTLSLFSASFLVLTACSSVTTKTKARDMSVSQLVERLAQPETDYDDRIEAIGELARHKDEAELIIPALTQEIHDFHSVQADESSVDILARFRARGLGVERAIIEHVLRCDRSHEKQCLKAFRDISPKNTQSADLILAGFQDDDKRGQIQRCKLLAELGPVAHGAIPILLPLLKDGRGDRQSYVLAALRSMGPTANIAIPDLLNLVDATENLRAVERTLLALGRPRLEDLSLLIFHTRSDFDDTRIQALRALGRLGADGKKATARIIQLLEDPSAEVRIEAIKVIGAMGPDAKSALPKLFLLRKTGHYETLKAVEEAVRALSHDGERKNSVL